MSINANSQGFIVQQTHEGSLNPLSQTPQAVTKVPCPAKTLTQHNFIKCGAPGSSHGKLSHPADSAHH